MPRVVCKTEQLTCLDVSSSDEGRWGKVYLLWVAKQLVYLKHRYLTEVVLWLYVMVTFWFQATQGASFAHGWRNFDPPRFAPHPISPPSPKRRGSHPFVSPNSREEDHIHSCCTSLTLPSAKKMIHRFCTCQLAWFWFSDCGHVSDVVWVQLHVFHFTVDRRRRMAYRIFILYIYI